MAAEVTRRIVVPAITGVRLLMSAATTGFEMALCFLRSFAANSTAGFGIICPEHTEPPFPVASDKCHVSTMTTVTTADAILWRYVTSGAPAELSFSF